MQLLARNAQLAAVQGRQVRATRQLGIARDGERAVDGAELERMGEADLRDALPGIAVFARVQPAQKLRIVEALQARGEVVACLSPL